MKAMAGSAGQTVKTQINRRIIACFWNKGRAAWGDEVEMGILATGFLDGTKVKFEIFESDNGADDDAVKQVDASLDKGRAKIKWKIDFKDQDPDEGDVYEFYFIATVAGDVKNEKKDCPILFCDLDPPGFSE